MKHAMTFSISIVKNGDTVNMVIFAGGNLSEMLARYFTWGKFSRYESFLIHKGIWVLFLRGGYFREEDRATISEFTVL